MFYSDDKIIYDLFMYIVIMADRANDINTLAPIIDAISSASEHQVHEDKYENEEERIDPVLVKIKKI
jgi:hypothetical protein